MPRGDALRIRQVRSPCQRSDIKSFWQLTFLPVATSQGGRRSWRRWPKARQGGLRMIFEERFNQVERQLLLHRQTLRTASGLSFHASSTSWIGFHEAFKGEDGTELVIGEHSEISIAFAQEVESLRLEYYVVSDFLSEDLHMLFDAENIDYDLVAPSPRIFYWLTLEGSGFRDARPGPIATHPYYQVIDGPFRRLTISTSHAGTVHIRKLEWTGTHRH